MLASLVGKEKELNMFFKDVSSLKLIAIRSQVDLNNTGNKVKFCFKYITKRQKVKYFNIHISYDGRTTIIDETLTLGPYTKEIYTMISLSICIIQNELLPIIMPDIYVRIMHSVISYPAHFTECSL
ncbi:hypothetical protein [Bacillus toyonensis]|uniref:hypothetical protein n=1 Tax=Bacillus toyonensis TaxID=155322 RepID=UPI002E2107FD|nr:hypothetical protein [Bacillus toyonensis]